MEIGELALLRKTTHRTLHSPNTADAMLHNQKLPADAKEIKVHIPAGLTVLNKGRVLGIGGMTFKQVGLYEVVPDQILEIESVVNFAKAYDEWLFVMSDETAATHLHITQEP